MKTYWVSILYILAANTTSRSVATSVNLDHILTPFEKCIVHLTTFKTSLHSVPNGPKNTGEVELDPITIVPVVLSFYKTILNLETVYTVPFLNLQGLPNAINSSRPAFHFIPMLRKTLECYVKMYTLSFWAQELNDVAFFITLPTGHHDLLIPWVWSRSREKVDYYNGIDEENSDLSMPNYNVFQIVIAELIRTVPMKNIFDFSEKLALMGLSPASNLQPLTLLYLIQKKPKPYYLLKNWKHVVLFEIDMPTIPTHQMLLIQLYKVYMKNLPMKRQCLDIHHPGLTNSRQNFITQNMKEILHNPKFVDFKKWMLTDVILMHNAFPNASSECQLCMMKLL